MGWTWERIRVSPTRTMMPLGDRSPRPITSPLLAGPRGESLDGFYHWMQRDKALRWRDASRARLAAVKAAKDSVDGLKAMRLLVEAIADYYNALNVPWYLHRDARELYWRHVSGVPTPSAFFSSVTDSVQGWYTPHFPVPVIDDSSTGLIPKIARDLYKSKSNDRGVQRNDFVPTVGIGIGIAGFKDLPDASKGDFRAVSFTDDWYYKVDPGIRNQGFVAEFLPAQGKVFQYCSDRDNPLALPFDACNDMGSPVPLPWDGWSVRGAAEGHPTLGDKLADRTDDWKSFRGDFGLHLNNDPMRVSLGAWFYVQWLSDWVDLLFAQDPADVVCSVRENALYINNRLIGTNGRGAQAILQAAGEQFQQATTVDPAIRITEAAVGAAGAALASVTYGISAIVAAAVDLGIEIGIAVAGPNPMAIRKRRDDLGRYKQVFERASLDGNDGAGDSDQAPQTLVVDDPPESAATRGMLSLQPGLVGVLLPGSYLEQAANPTNTDPQRSGSDKPADDGTGKTGTGTKLVIGAAAVAALAKIFGAF